MNKSQTTNSHRESGSVTKQIRRKYNISSKVLGTGSFGKVFLAQGAKDPDFKVAIKAISKKKVDAQDLKQMKQELSILQSLDHPHVVKYYESYENSNYFYIVMEYCPGGDLFDLLTVKAKNKVLAESLVAEIMSDVLHAIAHCHANNIAHRDIKADNVMVGEDGQIKLIDFGLSKKNQTARTKMKDMVGTPYYIAPEVLKGKYVAKCDLWSAGVLLYILLSGYIPFNGESATEVYEAILDGHYSMKQKEWKKVSEDGKDLLSKLLTKDYKKRISASDALNHPWFKNCEEFKGDEDKDPLDEQMLDNLVEYKGSTKLKRAAINLLVKMLPTKEVEGLKKQFVQIDTDHSGCIDAEELATAMKQNPSIKVPDEEIDRIISEVDFAGNGRINYSEFLAATIRVKEVLSEARLFTLFTQFDSDGTNQISVENLREVFHRMEMDLTEKEIDEILKEHDIEGDKQISFMEFKSMMEEQKELYPVQTPPLAQAD